MNARSNLKALVIDSDPYTVGKIIGLMAADPRIRVLNRVPNGSLSTAYFPKGNLSKTSSRKEKV
jgi:hypothetical protein